MAKTKQPKWCDISDLPASQCAHCQGLEIEEDDTPAEMVWPAKFAGTCDRCDGRFEAREMITFVGGGYGHAEVEDCA